MVVKSLHFALPQKAGNRSDPTHQDPCLNETSARDPQLMYMYDFANSNASTRVTITQVYSYGKYFRSVLAVHKLTLTHTVFTVYLCLT